MRSVGRNVEFSRHPLERGATAIEYAGIVFLVVSLTISLMMIVPGWGATIVCKVSSAVSKVSGQNAWDCGGSNGSKKSDKHKPKKACAVNRRSRSLNGSAGIVLGVEVKGSLIIEQMSDGTYKITDTTGVKVGISKHGVGVGGGAKVTIDNQDYGAYASASLKAGVTGNAGEVYVAKSEEEKNRYVEYLMRNAAANAGGAPVSVANKAYNFVDQYAFGNEPPKPNEYYIDLGVEGTASASAAAAVTGVKGSANGSHAIGMKVNVKDKTVTTYYKVAAGVSGGASSLNVGGEGEASADMMVAVTVDADNPEKVLNVSASGSASAEGGEKLPPGLGSYESRDNAGLVWTASVDLNSEETKRMANDFMSAVGVNPSSSGSPQPEKVVDATNTFIEATVNKGVLTVQDVNKTTSNYGAEAGIKFVIGAGLGVTYTDQEVKMSNGRYYDAETGRWETWEGC